MASEKPAVPALRYTNPNERGVDFIKFDGIEAVGNEKILLIDAKTKLAIWSPSTQREVLSTMGRVRSALEQNPGFKVVYEFPNEKVAAEARFFIRQNGMDDVISVRTRNQ